MLLQKIYIHNNLSLSISNMTVVRMKISVYRNNDMKAHTECEGQAQHSGCTTYITHSEQMDIHHPASYIQPLLAKE
jgi:hypothetical protein